LRTTILVPISQCISQYPCHPHYQWFFGNETILKKFIPITQVFSKIPCFSIVFLVKSLVSPGFPFEGGLSLVPVGQPRGFAAGAGHEPETGAGAPVSGNKETTWDKCTGNFMVNVW
jgi:hypothetical protein